MIFDTLAHIDQYKTIHPGLYKALTILRDTDFSQMEDGRVEVDGTNLYYMLQSYETKPANDTPESHKAYADIQMMLIGEEKMGYGPLEDMTQVVEAYPDRDCWLHHGSMQHVVVTPGTFAIFFPGDAHAPGMAPAEPKAVRKCVVKVKL